MADNTGIRLLGFAGFEASERFLRALHDEIWVTRWDRSRISVDRPDSLDTAAAMRAALEQPSFITVVSAHAGYFCDGRRLGFCGAGDRPVLLADSVGSLGAASMLLIDACYAPDLAAEFKSHARPRSLIAGLDHEPGEEQVTRGKDSVTALGAVIRELCYPTDADLSPEAAARAIDIVNAQISARNDAERKRGVTNKKAMRPLIRVHEC
jgi:hypothetical protein